MLGNIRVGVAAGHCIEKVGRGRRWVRGSHGLPGMTALFAAGWMARIPAEDNHRIMSRCDGRRSGTSHRFMELS